MSKQPSKLFVNIAEGLDEILTNCKALKVCPVAEKKHLFVSVPMAARRIASFRGSVSFKELVEKHGRVFKFNIIDEGKCEITFKKETHDDEATIRRD